MCYPLPGPRCSSHARKELESAKQQLSADPTNTALLDRVNMAEKHYALTPAGIKELRDAGLTDEADKNEAYRKHLIERLKESLKNPSGFLTKSTVEKWANNLSTGSDIDDEIYETITRLVAKTTNISGGRGEHDPATVELIKEAENPNITVSDLERLAESEEKWVRKAVAENPNLTGNVAFKLSRDQWSPVKTALARNPKTPQKTLQWLAREWDTATRVAVAENPASTGETIDKVAKSLRPNLDIRRAVVSNPNTLSSTLRWFSESGPDEITRRISEHPNTNDSTLGRIASKAKELKVLENIKKHPAASEETLKLVRAKEELILTSK